MALDDMSAQALQNRVLGTGNGSPGRSTASASLCEIPKRSKSNPSGSPNRRKGKPSVSSRGGADAKAAEALSLISDGNYSSLSPASPMGLETVVTGPARSHAKPAPIAGSSGSSSQGDIRVQRGSGRNGVGGKMHRHVDNDVLSVSPLSPSLSPFSNMDDEHQRMFEEQQKTIASLDAEVKRLRAREKATADVERRAFQTLRQARGESKLKEEISMLQHRMRGHEDQWQRIDQIYKLEIDGLRRQLYDRNRNISAERNISLLAKRELEDYKRRNQIWQARLSEENERAKLVAAAAADEIAGLRARCGELQDALEAAQATVKSLESKLVTATTSHSDTNGTLSDDRDNGETTQGATDSESQQHEKQSLFESVFFIAFLLLGLFCLINVVRNLTHAPSQDLRHFIPT